MGLATNKSEQPMMLLLQFYVDLFEEAGVMPDFLTEAVGRQLNLRDFTYVDEGKVQQILSLTRGLYKDMPKRTVDDGFDLHKNYCNSQFAWVFTAKNVLELFQRFKRFDPKGAMQIVRLDKDTVKISLRPVFGFDVYEHMFCISALLGMLRACVSDVEIDVHYASQQRDLETYVRDRGECNVKSDAPEPYLVLHAPNLLEMPLLTRNDALSAILEPKGEFVYVDLCKSDLVSEASELIKKSLHKQDFSLNDLAADMGASRRTLQRRLKEQQLTFNKLLRVERRKKAIQLIDEGEHDRSRIVEMVGYRELSSLYRLMRTN